MSTTLLRRSAFLATRRSLQTARRIPRASLRYSPVSYPVRRYATVQPPEPPGEPQDKKKLESHGDKQENRSDGPPPQPELEPGYVRLTPEQEKHFEEVVSKLKSGMPKSAGKEIDNVFEVMRKEGVPKVLQEILEEVRGGKTPDLAMAVRLVRVANQAARRTSEKAMKEKFFESKESKESRGENIPPDQEPQQKAGAHDPGPQQKDQEGKQKSKGDKKGKQSGPQPGGFTEINMDLGTTIMSTIAAYMLYRLIVPSENSREITWQEFRTTFLEKGLVEKITVLNNSRAKVYLHRDAVASMYPDSPATNPMFHYYFTIGSVEAFERKIEEAQNELQIPSAERIPIAYSDEASWGAVLFSFGPTLLFIGAIYWFSRRAASSGGSQSGIFGIGKSRAKKFNHETDIKVKFADVAGMDEAKQEIMEFVSFLKEPGVYQKLGAKIPRGAILSGPPGTGKTLLAKATAGESQVPFFSVSGSEFVEMFVGVGPSRVRDLFANARKNTPCIIFIDEIDAIGKSRAKQNFGGGNDERESTLNQILTEMDGFNTSEQVVVLAGTNRPDVLDKALMRPGRFDRHITIDRPTMDGRRQIFAVHLKKIVTNENVEFLKGRLAALTPGFSGADIANCVNEAALIAARHKADSVEMVHFEQAIERVIGGLEKKSLVLTPEEKKTVAYHEAGHAICGWYFKYADPLLKVSIIPRGQGALGYAQYLPAGDTYLMNVNQLMDRMAMTLGGRVSEELHFDTVTSGASDDFNKVTRMATAMVTKWGMSRKIGYLYFEDDSSQQLHKPFSEETAKNIDMEVRRIVDEAYKQCKDLLIEKKEQIGIVAEELLNKEMLAREDLIRLLGPRPWEDPKDFHKYFGGKGDTQGAESGIPGPSTPTPDIGGGESAPGPIGGATPAPTAFRRL